MVTVVGRAAVVPLPVTRLSGETWITPSVACAADTTPTNEEVGLVVSVPVDVEYRAAPSTNAEVFRRSEEHTSELQSLMRISYAVFCLKKKSLKSRHTYTTRQHSHAL